MNIQHRVCLTGTLLTLCTLTGLTALTGLTGCASKDRLQTYPVEGKLLLDGYPVGNANVYFYPCDPGQQRISVAVTDPDGTFRLTTFSPGDGAPEGDYDV